MKIAQALESPSVLLKGVTEIIKNEAKVQKVSFLFKLLGALEASLLGNVLTGKGTVRAGEVTVKAGKGIKKI